MLSFSIDLFVRRSHWFNFPRFSILQKYWMLFCYSFNCSRWKMFLSFVINVLYNEHLLFYFSWRCRWGLFCKSTFSISISVHPNFDKRINSIEYHFCNISYSNRQKESYILISMWVWQTCLSIKAFMGRYKKCLILLSSENVKFLN